MTQLSVKLENAYVLHVHFERFKDMWYKAEELLSTLFWHLVILKRVDK